MIDNTTKHLKKQVRELCRFIIQYYNTTQQWHILCRPPPILGGGVTGTKYSCTLRSGWWACKQKITTWTSLQWHYFNHVRDIKSHELGSQQENTWIRASQQTNTWIRKSQQEITWIRTSEKLTYKRQQIMWKFKRNIVNVYIGSNTRRHVKHTKDYVHEQRVGQLKHFKLRGITWKYKEP